MPKLIKLSKTSVEVATHTHTHARPPPKKKYLVLAPQKKTIKG